MLFTVIGIYEDTGQRYADTFEALSAEHAEMQAKDAAGPTLMVAGVVLGEVEVVA